MVTGGLKPVLPWKLSARPQFAASAVPQSAMKAKMLKISLPRPVPQSALASDEPRVEARRQMPTVAIEEIGLGLDVGVGSTGLRTYSRRRLCRRGIGRGRGAACREPTTSRSHSRCLDVTAVQSAARHPRAAYCADNARPRSRHDGAGGLHRGDRRLPEPWQCRHLRHRAIEQMRQAAQMHHRRLCGRRQGAVIRSHHPGPWRDIERRGGEAILRHESQNGRRHCTSLAPMPRILTAGSRAGDFGRL
jgi:hypothetical protein